MESFVDDGYERALAAIRAEVQAKYAEQLKCASRAERRTVKTKIEAEIREAIDRWAPPSALY